MSGGKKKKSGITIKKWGLAQNAGGIRWMCPACEDNSRLWFGNKRAEAPVVTHECRGKCFPGLLRIIMLGKGAQRFGLLCSLHAMTISIATIPNLSEMVEVTKGH